MQCILVVLISILFPNKITFGCKSGRRDNGLYNEWQRRMKVNTRISPQIVYILKIGIGSLKRYGKQTVDLRWQNNSKHVRSGGI